MLRTGEGAAQRPAARLRRVRLAFAVAAYLEPEILLVDEVLAGGTQRLKSSVLGKIGDVAKEGRTVNVS